MAAPLVAVPPSPVHKNRLAANKHISTDPDVTAIAVMLIKLRAAVESTIEKRHAAGTARFARAPLDLDRFFAAMMNSLGGQAALQPDPDAPLPGCSPIMWRTMAGLQDQTLKLGGKRNLTGE
jgi:hypothetical protein